MLNSDERESLGPRQGRRETEFATAARATWPHEHKLYLNGLWLLECKISGEQYSTPIKRITSITSCYIPAFHQGNAEVAASKEAAYIHKFSPSDRRVIMPRANK